MAPITKVIISAMALMVIAPSMAAPIASQGVVARQLAGEGAAADSIFSGTDNAVGYSVEEIEDNTANMISGGNTQPTGGSTGGGSSPPPPPPPPHRRQLDKISNGFAALGNAVGAGAVADPVAQQGDTIDGEGTSGAANAGATIGSTEESTLEGIAKNVPKN